MVFFILVSELKWAIISCHNDNMITETKVRKALYLIIYILLT